MRIGIDCRTILNPGSGEGAGVGHYTHYLVNELLALDRKNTYVLFFDSRLRDIEVFARPNVVLRRFPFSSYRRFLPFTYSHMLVAAALLKERLDVFHNPANVLPLTYRRPSVITVHDLAIYKNPSWFPGQVFSRHLLVPQSVKMAKAIIAVSESTKHDLRELFSTPAKKIHVVLEGVDVRPIKVKDRGVDAQQKFHLRKRYLLFMGTLEARKNLVRLVQAFGRLLETNGQALDDVTLVLAGNRGWKSEEVFNQIKELKLERRVKWIGYVTQNEKLALMRGAAAFVYPSVYEGFGLPVLEALALGVPVVTSEVSSLPEVAGPAARYVNPEEINDIREGLSDVLFNERLRAKLHAAGPKQAKRFSWQRCASETLAVYQGVGQGVGRRNNKRKKH